MVNPAPDPARPLINPERKPRLILTPEKRKLFETARPVYYPCAEDPLAGVRRWEAAIRRRQETKAESV